MRKKRILTLSGILLGVLMCFNFNKVQAVDSVFSDTRLTRETLSTVAQENSLEKVIVPITLKIDKSNYKTNNGETIWSIADKDKNYKDIYCININRGFGAPSGVITNENSEKTYTKQYDFNDSNFYQYTGLDEATKSKVVWILKNSVTSTEDLTTLLAKASPKLYDNRRNFTQYVEEDMKKNDDSRTALSFDDIKTVQQIAIWNYTNPNSVFKGGVDSLCNADGKQISAIQTPTIHISTDTYEGDVRAGEIIQAKISALYKYFIDGAESITSINNETPVIEFDNSLTQKISESKDQDSLIVGPYKLIGTNKDKIDETIQYEMKGKLVDKNEKEINYLSDFINGEEFYIKISKNLIKTANTEFKLILKYKYNDRTLTFLTDETDPDKTQPVASIKKETIEKDITINFSITKVSVEKIWNDYKNQDGMRPETVKVRLLEDGKEKDTIELNNNKLTHTWYILLKDEDKGKTYTVVELDEKGQQINGNGKYNYAYSTEYKQDEATTIITNTHTPEKISKTVTKVWDDENNQDGIRPEKIYVTLYKEVNGTKTVVEENVEITDALKDEKDNWIYTWNNLPKYENGKPIVYTVEEKAMNGYTPNYSTDTFTITNKYVPGTVSRTVTKVWSDNNNQDGIRPTTVTVQLYADGVAKGEAVTLNEGINWTKTWTGLPEKQNGTKINYEIKEIKIGNTEVVENKAGGYTVSNKNVDNITTIIENTHTVETIEKTVIKQWEDNDNSARPTSVKVQLYANGVEKYSPVELNDKNNWKATWSGLEKNQDGKPIVYTVKEIPVNGYEASYSAESFDENTDTIIITNKYISIDFSLRKFITAVNDTELKSEDGKYLREPKVDQTVIGTKDASGNTITTAIYKHTKEPIAVQKGDTVTYTIRVYNEGETDGYVSKITDHLPEWLEFLPDDELNKKYLWTQDTNNNRTITTDIASKGKVTGEEIYSQRENKQMLSKYNKSGDLDFIDVQIKCKVKDTVVNEQLITNIADISGMQNKNGEDIEKDIDSAKDNVQLPTDAELPNYKGKTTNKDDLTDKEYYYAGQEEDDDFEKLIVKNFDLSLRKFIIAVNNTELKSDIIDGSKYTREPEVDASKLGTKDANGNIITTATYTHPKTPVQVKKGDKVIYIIRVYNEGSLAGYATKIIENVPEGLTFVENSETNKKYSWKVEDGKLTTDYLADKIINPVSVVETTGNKNLDYKDIEVEFEVTAEPSKFAGKLITNWAEIGEDSNNDIDSTPGNDVKTEDDIDYEPLELTYFDLALRKFITNVNGTEYNNRVPEVDTSKLGTVDPITGEKITTATYTHTKDPVIVETGSTVIYTIRVYNEGTADGYANEITDDIPDGLEFLPEHEVNSGKDGYKWVMLDEEGKITQDVSKAKKITTNYLSENNDPTKVLSGYKEENGAKTLSYQDVKVAFKVIEPKNSKRIVINTAEISKASMEDIDSIPGNSKIEEDDIDNEYLRVETFDLALKKWVTETRVTYKGKTTTTKTGFTADSTEMAKVDIVASRLKSTTVKFVYNIQIINEGQVAGTATEIKDYVPSGLKFEEEDNEGWVYDKKDDSVTTTQLKDKVIEPGKSETVQIVLTWKNSTTNMGVKTNWAEISADNGDDVDSTPNNFDKLEDDIDDAKVILSIKTGSAKLYIALAVISIAILGGGTFAIKKYVIDK